MKGKVIAITAVAFLSGLLPAQANTVDYHALGTFSTPSLDLGGVMVTGSANVYVLNLNGLGVVGGASNTTVGSTEFISFAFSSPVINVSYYNHLQYPGSTRVLEAFGVGGASLGTVVQTGSGDVLVSALFANVPIVGFRLSPTGSDVVRIGSVSFDISQTPAPAALPLFAFGLGALGMLGWHRKRKAQALSA